MFICTTKGRAPCLGDQYLSPVPIVSEQILPTDVASWCCIILYKGYVNKSQYNKNIKII